MGWSFKVHDSGQTKAEFMKELIQLCTDSDYETLRHSVRGNTLWMVVRHKIKDHRAILCFLISKQRNGGWGYKDLDETMGPCEVSCPLAFLDMVPDPGSYATEWRARVRAWHSAQKIKRTRAATLVPGMRVRLVTGVLIGGYKIDYPVTITGVDGRTVHCDARIPGAPYPYYARLRPSLVAEVIHE